MLLGKLVLLLEIMFFMFPILILMFLYNTTIPITQYQKITITVAVILFMIVMFVYVMAIRNNRKSWYPLVSDCPDYWEAIENGEDDADAAKKCINTKDLGTCAPPGNEDHLTMDFGLDEFSGKGGNCNKYNWATNCDILWDGITYGVTNPCLEHD
jgi:hypothetical protein